MGQCIINRTTQPLYWGDGNTPTAVDEVNELFKRLYPVGSVYYNTNNVNPATIITGTTWQLISSVALVSENVFGNGIALGLSNGTELGAFGVYNGNAQPAKNVFGSAVGITGVQTSVANDKLIGSPTKTQLGDHPEYSGLIADTITVYMWERIA